MAMDPGGRIVAQRPQAAKTSNIAAVKDLLGPLDTAGAVVTADALHTRHTTARLIAERFPADYVDGGQPGGKVGDQRGVHGRLGAQRSPL
ncbi:hypothetical protein [Nocardiopsis halophila]|uniref:hypothetical protein n=1 Tax=Nocardiopsis halophila TaxID=141692 RepID=UPI0012679C49|nr:hypothetical protein [Nocardiopsis halophila]